MPEYIYTDSKGHNRGVTHSMTYSTAVVCVCGETMWRKPQGFYVTWGGLKPSQGQMSPAVRNLLDDTPQRREEGSGK